MTSTAFCLCDIEQEHRVTVLVPRQEMTGADRQWAAQYEPGDIVRYARGNQAVGVKSGEYVHVTGVDREQNLLTVERENGQQLTYDPHRLHGVSVYREAERDFSAGDRVQFTAPYREEHVANRQLGTVETDRRRGKFASSAGLRPGCAIQHPGAPPSRPRLCRHQPQQPGSHRRPRVWCTWTPNRPTTSLSIHGWGMSPSRAGATMHRFTRGVAQTSVLYLRP